MKQIDRDNILIGLQKGQVEIDSKIDVVNRGLYGDKANKTLGLIDRQALDDKKFEAFMTQMTEMNKEVKTNSRFRKKVSKITAVTTGGGFTATTVTAIAFFKEIKEFVTAIFN